MERTDLDIFVSMLERAGLAYARNPEVGDIAYVADKAPTDESVVEHCIDIELAESAMTNESNAETICAARFRASDGALLGFSTWEG